MAKADKATAVAEITEQFKASSATVVTEYRGLTVSNLAELRRSLGGSATYSVAKNTLARRAASEAGVEGLDELFVGPTAIAFVKGEPVDAAKALKTFARDNKALVIKGGYMDGRLLSVAEIERIADLESREVLLAKMAGAMKGNLAKAAGLFNAPASQMARLLAALQDKRQAGQESPAGAAAPEGGASESGASESGSSESGSSEGGSSECAASGGAASESPAGAAGAGASGGAASESPAGAAGAGASGGAASESPEGAAASAQ